ncbi:MAG TPA: ATP-dependent DNA helicase RecG, partial [Bacillota bacterium]
MATSILSQPVRRLEGVGPQRARLLERLGIRNIGQLIEHFPRRYERVGATRPIAQAVRGEEPLQRVRGRIIAAGEQRPHGRLHLSKIAVSDGSGVLWAVWFNQPYVLQKLRRGRIVTLTGRIQWRFGQWQMANPAYDLEEVDPGNGAGSLLPVYPATAGLSQTVLRRWVRHALALAGDALEENLPPAMLQRWGLPSRRQALEHVHFPPDEAALGRARERLAFEELLLLQLALGLIRRDAQTAGGIAQPADTRRLRRFLNQLPHRPTRAQQRAIAQILADMAAPRPMNRLLQGDVGSGKTLVASVALWNAACNGHQAVLMAPTELLAEQHAQRLGPLLAAEGIRLGLLTGSSRRPERSTVLAAAARGELDVLVGTHALLEDAVQLPRLSLVVTDEQHRFGVRQRARLVAKGRSPDVLVMTATPIPRTLALTFYGDLDVSVLDELPPGRQRIETRWLRPAQRARAYRFVESQLAVGRQAYVICPAVSESENRDHQAAETWYRRLVRAFPRRRVALLHGRLPAAEKDAVMRAFREGAIDLLVATSVVEVGIDVPNANVMVIEDAHRFGLAQLHQLRGRVGRGSHRSYCLLIAEPTTAAADERLRVLEQTEDGFVIAERDLELRGPGEVLGTRQHGLPLLRVADPARDGHLLERAQAEARRLLATDPQLERPEHRSLRQSLLDRY